MRRPSSSSCPCRHRSGSSGHRQLECRASALLLGAAAVLTAAATAVTVWLAVTSSSALSIGSSSPGQDRSLWHALLGRPPDDNDEEDDSSADGWGVGDGELEAGAASSRVGGRVIARTSIHQLLPPMEQHHQPSASSGRASSVRYHPVSFHPVSRVGNLTVLCDPLSQADAKEFFADPTWRCNNISVDGHRLPFYESTPHSLNEQTLNPHIGLGGGRFQAAPAGVCGRLSQRRANLFLLCGLLLRQLPLLPRPLAAHGPGAREKLQQQLPWLAASVKIPHGNCSYPEKRRIILTGREPKEAGWLVEDFWNPGFITDVVCSFAVPCTASSACS